MQTARTILIAGGGVAGLALATRLGHSLGRTAARPDPFDLAVGAERLDRLVQPRIRFS
jgi:NADH dehydrogenase FAD-containing subunit